MKTAPQKIAALLWQAMLLIPMAGTPSITSAQEEMPAPPEMHFGAPSTPSTQGAATPGTKEPKPPIRIDLNTLSLFFSKGDRDVIAQARDQYLKRGTSSEVSEADLLDQLQGIKAAIKTEEDLPEKFAPQFYLESLIYHTPNDWTLWIRGSEANKKFLPTMLASKELGLKLIALEKEEVTFEWTPRNWARSAENFKKESPLLKLDSVRHVILFTLRVNQTFTGSDMSIHEGYVAPVSLENAQESLGKPLPGAPAPATNDTPTASSPQDTMNP